MSIFVIFKVSHQDKLQEALERVFPEDHLRVDATEWLVSAKMTSKEVCDHLGISDGSTTSAVVFKMESYFGRAATSIWDWIKTKSEGA
ncbi:hypothetical protein [Rhizobium tumorigenes]|uniref:Uncharacterized protein n=1 Tax=Rhizobium tumorigenes TaxID=2041385 RepID=A0AAF1K9E5_9HYPH|nr:hypothetical protein [Rhizobium tumorigenes]WFR98722.1 hypothetical protein PR017_23770 [Rhizobium tumorigenes]